MSETQALDMFLDDTGWGAALRHPLAADASNRHYVRLLDPQRGATALVMIAPPNKEPKTGLFVKLSGWLNAHGFSAPDIMKADLSSGLVLLEDFGDGSFASILESAPQREHGLYASAGDIVSELSERPRPQVPNYDSAALITELDIFCDHWWPDGVGTPMPDDIRKAFFEAWKEPLALIARTTNAHPTLTLRDFHKDNLFHLPARDGIASVGLIDFQDAVIGHPAYDLVSLLQDVRRDIPQNVQASVFRQVAGVSADPDFQDVYKLLGAQRALKILGVFVRLDTVYGKPQYRTHLERTWQRVHMNLDHPLFTPLKHWFDQHIPAHGEAGP